MDSSIRSVWMAVSLGFSGLPGLLAGGAFAPFKGFRAAKTLAQGEFTSPEHFNHKGWSGPAARETQNKRTSVRMSFYFGAADGSRTRTPVRTQAPQACQSTNSSTAANKRLFKTALLLYFPVNRLSMVFPVLNATFYFSAGPAWPHAPGAALSTAAGKSRRG